MKPEVILVATETLGELLSRCKTPQDFHALIKTLFNQVAERALQAEVTHHLGYDKHQIAGHNSGNARNGTSKKRYKPNKARLSWLFRATVLRCLSRALLANTQCRVSSVTDAIIRLYAPTA